MLERPAELRALRQRAERLVELLVETEVLEERLDARRASDVVERPTASAQSRELVIRLQPLGREARSRALEHAAELDRVVDVGPGELVNHEAAAGERLEEPFALEVMRAIRSGVRETPSSSTRRSSATRSRGSKAPFSRSSRSPSVAFVVCEFATFPRGTTSSVTAHAAGLRAIETLQPPCTRALTLILYAAPQRSPE